jgi:hypothetical protein
MLLLIAYSYFENPDNCPGCRCDYPYQYQGFLRNLALDDNPKDKTPETQLCDINNYFTKV